MENIGSLFGRPIGQYWEDLELWESVLNRFDFQWIVELGTWQGGMSYFFWSQCLARGMTFRTYDVVPPDNPVPGFIQRNVMTGLNYDAAQMMEDSPGILFCDNGNKPREVKTYYLDLHKECMIAVHDWGTEFTPNDIPKTMRLYVQSSTTVFLARNDWLNELESRQEKGGE